MKRKNIFVLSILIVLYSAIYIGLNAYNTVYSPWIFGFVFEPESLYIQDNFIRTENYIQGQHQNSPLYRSFVQNIQLITGVHFEWIRIPGSILIFVLVTSIMKNVPADRRLIVAFVAVAGPLGIVGYTFTLLRAVLDLVLFLSLVLLLRSSYQSNTNNELSILIFFSAIIWLNHYSFWPFFAAFSVLYLSILYINGDLQISSVASSTIIFAPLIAYIYPSQVYVRSLPVLFTRDFSASDMLFPTSYFSGQSTQIPPNGIVLPGIGSPGPDWMMGGVYIIYFLLLTPLLVFLSYNLLKKVYRKFTHGMNPQLPYHLVLLMSVGGSVVITTIIYAAIGYVYRLFIFWPIVIALIGYSLFNLYDGSVDLPSKKVRSSMYNVITIIIILIAMVHMLPILTPGFDYIDRTPSAPSEKQITSTEFSGHTTNDIPTYTTLSHASITMINEEKRYLITGRGISLSNGSVVADEDTAVLYEPNRIDNGYILVTESDPSGIRTWSSAIPPTGDIGSNKCTNKIYTVGTDSWYRKYPCE